MLKRNTRICFKPLIGKYFFTLTVSIRSFIDCRIGSEEGVRKLYSGYVINHYIHSTSISDMFIAGSQQHCYVKLRMGQSKLVSIRKSNDSSLLIFAVCTRMRTIEFDSFLMSRRETLYQCFEWNVFWCTSKCYGQSYRFIKGREDEEKEYRLSIEMFRFGCKRIIRVFRVNVYFLQ